MQAFGGALTRARQGPQEFGDPRVKGTSSDRGLANAIGFFIARWDNKGAWGQGKLPLLAWMMNYALPTPSKYIEGLIALSSPRWMRGLEEDTINIGKYVLNNNEFRKKGEQPARKCVCHPNDEEEACKPQPMTSKRQGGNSNDDDVVLVRVITQASIVIKCNY